MPLSLLTADKQHISTRTTNRLYNPYQETLIPQHHVKKIKIILVNKLIPQRGHYLVQLILWWQLTKVLSHPFAQQQSQQHRPMCLSCSARWCFSISCRSAQHSSTGTCSVFLSHFHHRGEKPVTEAPLPVTDAHSSRSQSFPFFCELQSILKQAAGSDQKTSNVVAWLGTTQGTNLVCITDKWRLIWGALWTCFQQLLWTGHNLDILVFKQNIF